MADYVIGIDGGGTSCRAALADRNGTLLGRGKSGASNILTDRLARLEAHAILERRRDPADARRLVYRLTRRGIDLAPVLFEMILWAAQHEATAAPPQEVEAMERDRDSYLSAIRARWLASAG